MERESEYIPIPCEDYEAFEIACMDRYDVELTTRDGCKIVRNALDLAVRTPAEFLVIRHDDGRTADIRVDQVRYMAVLTRPCRFEDHTFTTRDSG